MKHDPQYLRLQLFGVSSVIINRTCCIADRLVGERQDALDQSQEAFVRAYGALASFDVSRPFGPWLYRIVTNLTLNHLHLRRVPTVPLDPAGYTPTATFKGVVRG